MSRRVARTRLYELQKSGENLVESAGTGISDSIGNSSRLRQGTLITSEITLDLANATAPASSFNAGAGIPDSAEGVSIIGVSSSVDNGVGLGHENANVIQIDKVSGATTENGVVTSGELVCVEAPLNGETVIGLWYGDNLSGSGEDMGAGSAQKLIEPATQVIGKETLFEVDVDINDKYLYLVSSGSAANPYTAGKFVLRLYGFNVFDDVS